MATSKYIRGLSGAGFRIPTNGSSTALQRVTEASNKQVDLDDRKTQLILAGERDNFVRVSASGSTTVTIIGLTRYGFRIKNNGGSIVTVKLGSGVHTIDLTNADARRILRRNFGRYAFSSSATALAIRGIQDEQNGFDIKASTGEDSSTIALDSGSNNAANTETVVVGSKTYTFKTSLTEAKATNTVNANGGAPADGNTVNVNGTVYTFKTALTPANGEVLINGQDGSLVNLAHAINGTGGTPGTDYEVAGAHATVTANATVTSHAITLTAKTIGVAGNAYTLSRVGANLGVGAATFSGGVDSVANEVKVGGSGDASLTNLSEAINAGANAGTDYSTATTANADASAGAVANHAIVLSAVEGGSQEIAVSTTAAHLTVSNATLEDTISKVYRNKTVTVNPQDPTVYTQLRRHFKSWIEA